MLFIFFVTSLLSIYAYKEALNHQSENDVSLLPEIHAIKLTIKYLHGWMQDLGPFSRVRKPRVSLCTPGIRRHKKRRPMSACYHIYMAG